MISISGNTNSDDDSSYSNNRWTSSDDKKLKELMKTLKGSTRIWKEISCLMPRKSAVQCRSRWNYKLNPKRQFKKQSNNGKMSRKLNPNDGESNDEFSVTSMSIDSMSLHSSVVSDDFPPSEIL